MSKENKNINLEEQQNNKNENKESNQNKDNSDNKNDILINDKINKPNDLKNFDAISHFKENISYFDKNCNEPVKDYSYYCFSCKHSVCNECGVYDHKEHLLIQRDNCLNYDSSFFNEISKVIEKGINVDSKKNQIKKEISKSIGELREELDILEKEKLDEIDKIFDNIKNNYIGLKENYLKTKECIENYYKVNKNFYNIKIIKADDIENMKNEVEKNNNNDNDKKMSTIDKNYYSLHYLNDNELGTNRDLENTVFLMNFELMNLCDNKNLQILDLSNDINNKIANISNLIEQKTNELKGQIKNYLNFDNNIISKFDDFYWDVKMRCEKYTEHISQFRNIVCEIIKKNGNLDKLKDLLSLFDAKNHKGKDCLFNQQFFIKMNDISSLSPEQNKSISKKKLYMASGRTRRSSKKKLIHRQNSQNNSTIKTKESKYNDKSKNSSNINNLKTIDKYNKINEPKNEFKRSNSNLNVKNSNIFINIDKESIILNQRILERFFAYSILDFYSKHFKVINLEDGEDDPYYYLNIYNHVKINNDFYNQLRHKDKDNNQTKRSHRSKSVKNGNKKNQNNYNYNNSNNTSKLASNANSKNKSKKNFGSQNSTFIRSVSLLSNYSERYTELKEKVKPIIGTNYVQFFEPSTNKITRVQIPLIKEIHGYSTFPDGCRHILIDQFLYITGGSDNCGYPINIVLMLNIEIGELTRISNLNDNHSYHSIEYLENYDCLILIGGEHSTSCEIMDLDSRKWTKLPSLNYPRANCNIYYNSITTDLFVLFGIESGMNDKAKYTDSIEVLELNDIISGWMKVDYYKTVGFDLKNNYCITLPFTRDKLLVFGGSTGRSIEKRIFALFDMIKNEIIKVDEKTMDIIKLEESKIKSFDKALEKIL